MKLKKYLACNLLCYDFIIEVKQELKIFYNILKNHHIKNTKKLKKVTEYTITFFLVNYNVNLAIDS